jgi:hypothetical protein
LICQDIAEDISPDFFRASKRPKAAFIDLGER